MREGTGQHHRRDPGDAGGRLGAWIQARGRARRPSALAAATGHSAAGEDRPGLRLLSYNIHAGIPATRYRDYFTEGWQHVLPSSRRLENLDRIAQVVARYDIVGLQEVDGGSLRSGYVNQVEYLAMRSGFPHWRHQLNRDFGRFAQHSNGLLSRYRPTSVETFRLPGMIPGRGLMVARFGSDDEPLVLLIAHLALGRRARGMQLEFIAELARDYRHVVLMGDLNSRLRHWGDCRPLRSVALRAPSADLPTFPSWRPQRSLDHILIGPTLRVRHVETLQCHYSDHLPIGMEVVLPPEVGLSPV